MRKLLFLSLFGWLFLSIDLSAKEPSLSEVLEWKYGPVAGTTQENANDTSASPKMVIYSWKHPSLPPPDETQIALDAQEYKDFLIQSEQEKKDKKDAALLKLKVSEEDLKDALRGVGVNVS